MGVMNKQKMEESNFLNEYKKAGWKLCSKILGIKEEETTTMNKQNSIEWFEFTDNIAEKLNELSKTYAICDVKYVVTWSPNMAYDKTYALIKAIRLDEPIFRDK